MDVIEYGILLAIGLGIGFYLFPIILSLGISIFLLFSKFIKYLFSPSQYNESKYTNSQDLVIFTKEDENEDIKKYKKEFQKKYEEFKSNLNK